MRAEFPIWIIVLGVFLALIGIGLGILGYVNPELALKSLNEKAVANNISLMIISARNIAMGSIMLIAVISKIPKLLSLVFVMRIITEFNINYCRFSKWALRCFYHQLSLLLF